MRLRTTVPLLADEYRRNRTTGGFILIDEATNRTVGAGMVEQPEPSQRGADEGLLPDTSTGRAGNGYSRARGYRIGRTAEEGRA